MVVEYLFGTEFVNGLKERVVSSDASCNSWLYMVLLYINLKILLWILN